MRRPGRRVWWGGGRRGGSSSPCLPEAPRRRLRRQPRPRLVRQGRHPPGPRASLPVRRSAPLELASKYVHFHSPTPEPLRLRLRAHGAPPRPVLGGERPASSHPSWGGTFPEDEFSLAAMKSTGAPAVTSMTTTVCRPRRDDKGGREDGTDRFGGGRRALFRGVGMHIFGFRARDEPIRRPKEGRRSGRADRVSARTRRPRRATGESHWRNTSLAILTRPTTRPTK